MTNDNREDLKPCPFCSSSNVRLDHNGCDAAVHCYECGARGEVIEYLGLTFEQIGERAVSKWNTRAALSPRPALPTQPENKMSDFDQWFKNKYGSTFEDCYMQPDFPHDGAVRALLRELRLYVSEAVADMQKEGVRL